jgi:hypothetical protein
MTPEAKAILDSATPRPWYNTVAVPENYVGDDNGKECTANYKLAGMAVNIFESLSLSHERLTKFAHDFCAVMSSETEGDALKAQIKSLYDEARAALTEASKVQP